MTDSDFLIDTLLEGQKQDGHTVTLTKAQFGALSGEIERLRLGKPLDPMEEVLKDLGVTPEWRLENIKETAMSRHNVKKGRRPHIKRILDEAFLLLKEGESQ